jgi:hypothetical protein
MIQHFYPAVPAIGLLLTLALAPLGSLLAQPGCTDPLAQNYAPSATDNDGSCTYPTTYYSPYEVAGLPGKLQEVSAIQRASDTRLWALADSGNDAVFYEIKTSNGNISQTVEVKKADNHDWEGFAADSTYLYIGDFGNNANNRQDLGIYRVPLAAIGNSDNEEVDDDEYTFFPFAYADQSDFEGVSSDSATFDCEAMLVHEGIVHLFNKNRLWNICTHYVVDTSTGLAIAQDSFATGGLVTAADISPDGKVIALLGYDLVGLPTVFVWLLWDWPEGRFFEGNKRRIELGSALVVGQAESIAFTGPRSGFLANEETAVNGAVFVEQTLWGFDIAPWVPMSVPTSTPGTPTFGLFPNPCTDMLYFTGTLPHRVVLYNVHGQVALEANAEHGIPFLDISTLHTGMYFCQIDGTGACVRVGKY